MGAAVKSGWEQRAQASGQVQPGVGGAELAWRPSGSRHPRSREDWPVQVQAVPSEAATSPGGRPKQGLLQVTPPPTKNPKHLILPADGARSQGNALDVLSQAGQIPKINCPCFHFPLIRKFLTASAGRTCGHVVCHVASE